MSMALSRSLFPPASVTASHLTPAIVYSTLFRYIPLVFLPNLTRSALGLGPISLQHVSDKAILSHVGHDPVSTVGAWRMGCVINTSSGYVDLNLIYCKVDSACHAASRNFWDSLQGRGVYVD